MKIAVVGTGYVGLVTGTCFAEMGNQVLCIDIDEQKIARMKKGEVPIYEPGLEEVFSRNIKEKRLVFSTNLQDAKESEIIFLALPTPPEQDGSADLSYLLGAAKNLSSILDDGTVVVDKSTVPVGTAQKVKQVFKDAKKNIHVVSNPEFLREGQAVNDFLNPERVVIGTSSLDAEKMMVELYEPFVNNDKEKIIVTDENSAEMIKYAANSFLAMKISFMNQLANLCERLGADIGAVRAGIGTDSRIGNQFLLAGPGYGGSCFPKDVLALSRMSNGVNYSFDILDAVMTANEKQKSVIPVKVNDYFKGKLEGKRIAVWGLAFKENTDDIRESPAIHIVRNLLDKGVTIHAFDPEASDNARSHFKNQSNFLVMNDQYKTLKEADALVIATPWREFSSPDFGLIKSKMKKPVIFDARNMFDVEVMREQKITYLSIGRGAVYFE